APGNPAQRPRVRWSGPSAVVTDHRIELIDLHDPGATQPFRGVSQIERVKSGMETPGQNSEHRRLVAPGSAAEHQQRHASGRSVNAVHSSERPARADGSGI